MGGNGVGKNMSLIIIQTHLVETRPVPSKAKRNILVDGTGSGEMEPTINIMKATIQPTAGMIDNL